MYNVRYFVNDKETTKERMPYTAGNHLDFVGIYEFLQALYDFKKFDVSVLVYIKEFTSDRYRIDKIIFHYDNGIVFSLEDNIKKCMNSYCVLLQVMKKLYS